MYQFDKSVEPLIFYALQLIEFVYNNFENGGENDDLPQNSLKARAPLNYLIINAEVISHKHFPTTRPEKRISPLISRHQTRVTGLQ